MSAVARVQVFGKGFRVSKESEEFQRLVPNQVGALREGLETELEEYREWASLLEPLYRLPERELTAQYCVLLSKDEIMAFAFAPTEDQHKRPSVVVVTATSPVSWGELGLPDAFDRSVGLANRLAGAYAEVFRGNERRVGEQLSKGTFLRERSLELRNERSGATLAWPFVVQAIREWQGITGVATGRLVALGANVIVGTRHEAEKANVRGAIAGYYDVREQRIIAIGDKLRLWPKIAPVEVKESESEPASMDGRAHDHLQSIDATLKRMDGSIRRLVDTADSLRQAVLEFWFPGGRSREKDDKKG